MIKEYFNRNYNDFENSRFVPSISEWRNSIYSYNKNMLNMIHEKDKAVYTLLDSYFNLKNDNKIIKIIKNDSFFFDIINKNFNNNIIYKLIKKIILKLVTNNTIMSNKVANKMNRTINILKKDNDNNEISKKEYIEYSWLSLNRIFIGIPEIKHSLNKVVIRICIFNKEKLHLLKKLNKLSKMYTLNKFSNKEFKYGLEKKMRKTGFIYRYIRNGIVSRFLFKNLDSYKYINNFMYYWEKIINYTQKKLTNNQYKYINNYNNKTLLLLYNNYNSYLIKTIEEVLNKKLKKLFLYKQYTAKIYLNNFKFNIINLTNLKIIFNKLYNKQVDINIINMKYFYLENNMFVNGIARKLNDRRKRVLKVIRKALRPAKIAILDSLLLIPVKKYNKVLKYNMINKKYGDFIFNYMKDKQKIVFKQLKNMHVIGIRLEAKGRLTKRLTASRSVYKLSYKGGLKNIYSSYQYMPRIMLKGFEKSNIKYTNTGSKNRNGSFGIKSWVSTY